MYTPPHFEQTQNGYFQRIMQTHPLGVLVTGGPDGLDADHIPFEFDAAAGPLGMLSAHVARANPVWQRCPTGTDVMVIFRGAQAYISPNWYPSKQEFHRQVPTWNYEVVHVHGTITILDDERFVRGLVARLTRHHEAAEPSPWKMGDSAPDFIDDMLGKVVGLQIAITSLKGKAKLSQNKETRDQLGAAQTLSSRGHEELAQAMQAGATASIPKA